MLNHPRIEDRNSTKNKLFLVSILPSKKKKSGTELTASVLKKRSKIHQRFKRTCFYLDKTRQSLQIFEEILLFQAMYSIKQTIHLPFASWLLVEGRGHKTALAQTDWQTLISGPNLGQSCALFLPQATSWQKVSELFVFMLYVAWGKRISSKMCALRLVFSN